MNLNKSALLFLVCLIGCNERVTESELPNIVLMVIDDLGYADMSCVGTSMDVHTPNIDKIARKGVRFTNAYATSPICSPSRGGLITGSYQQRWGTSWYGGPGLHDTTFQTIPELLKPKGYTSAYIGKVHYGQFDSDTSHRSFPLNHGFDYFFGHTSARKHYLSHVRANEEDFLAKKRAFNREGQSLRQEPMWRNVSYVDTMAFSTQMFADEASEFITLNQDKPFFLQLSFNAVHNFTHQLPEGYLKDQGLKGYHDWDPEVEEYYEWYKKGRYPNNPEGRAHYLGHLYYLDNAIGQVLSSLQESGVAKNTIVILMGDNGGSTPIYANNSPLRGSKYLMYEGGIRVPLLISYDGIQNAGQSLDNVVSGLDILPTLCALTGIDIPTSVDGINLRPLLDQNDTTINSDTLYWFTGPEAAIRIDNWKYHEVHDDAHAIYEMVELKMGNGLYNLSEDVGESNNLIEEYPEKAKELRQALYAWMETHGLETFATGD